MSTALENMHLSMTSNETHIQLSAMEMKIRHLLSENYHTKETASTEAFACDYSGIKNELVSLIAQHEVLLDKRYGKLVK